MQHFLLPDANLESAELSISDKELVQQMLKVLRFRVGDECVLLDGQGGRAKGVITELHKKAAVIAVSDFERLPQPERVIRLYCALSKKPSTFELIVQKATELGVTEIIPVVTKRCQVDHLRKAERLELIIKEACEQCERVWAPELTEAVKLEELLVNMPAGTFLAGDARIEGPLLKDVNMAQEVNLLIGPEGGLTDEELDAVKAAGGQLFLLGDSVLRMETAAIAALALVAFG